jgi:acetyl-CoA carboxylase alpha subunit
MTAPLPSKVVKGPWKQRPATIDQRASIVAEIETLERRQVARHAELAKLSELIERRQQDIEHLKGQL